MIHSIIDRRILLLLLLIIAVPCRVQANEFAVRLGAGPAFAGGVGASGLFALQFTHENLLLRADAKGIFTGRDTWENSARAVAFGAGAGLRSGRSPAGHRRYVLGTVASGVDVREGDSFTALGVAFGYDIARRPGIFGEFHYEYWKQTGATHYDLPSSYVSIVVGLVTG